MEEVGMASVWLGKVDSEEALREFLEFVYNEDGESTSPFTQRFDTDWIDEDFLAAEKIENTARIATALQGFPESEKIIPQIESLVGAELDQAVNAVVVLYDFNYDDRVRRASGEGIQLAFVGTANCRN